MRINWKRSIVGVLILTSLSFCLFGCGGSGDSTSYATDKLSGRVSNPSTGLSVANASVTAYPVSSTGVPGSTPLSIPSTVQSDSQGNYTLDIKSPYSGLIMVVASIPGSTQPVRSLISTSGTQTPISTGMVSLATEMAVEYIIQNLNGVFTPINLQTATQVLTPFFGQNYPQVPPPVLGTTPNKAQQDLLVMTQAVNTLLNTTTTIADLVTIVPANPPTNIILLGTEPTLSALNGAVITVSNDLINSGTIPGGYIIPPISPIPPPIIPPDTSKPTPPTNINYTATATTVTVTWGAATDNVGVTGYYIYRDGVFIGSTLAPAVTFTDSLVLPSTTYTYTVTARDAAGNSSDGSSIQVTTSAPPTVPTYMISGKISLNGSGLAGVPVSLSGLGTGISITDSNGNYSFIGVINGSYTLTPSLTGYSFTPVSITISVNSTDSTNNNFIATPDGSVTGGVVLPDATIIGAVTYPSGTVIGGVTYPTAVIIVSTTYPSGSVQGGVVYPAGTVAGGVTFPAGTIIGGTTYPGGTIIGGIFYPGGTVTGGTTYPNGVIIGGVSYPSGTIVGGVTYPPGTLSGSISYPPASVTGTSIYPAGNIAGATTYPTGGVTGSLLFP